MIGRLTGVLAAESGDDSFVLDVSGVGYELVAPLGALGRARANPGPGETLTFYIHTHVREDALSLFAFATAEDKSAFRTLISVSNVGPKMALAVLSAMTADDLARAVAEKNLTKLVDVPGIGRKTAERLLLELKDRLAPPAPKNVAARADGATRHAGPSNAELLTMTLTRLGYRASEAERVIAQLGPRVEGEPMQTLVREALLLLAR